MAFVATNPPCLLVQRLSDGPAIWAYQSADDDATVNGTDYFASCEKYGMQVGDMVWVYDTATPRGSVHFVSAIDTDGNVTVAFAFVA